MPYLPYTARCFKLAGDDWPSPFRLVGFYESVQGAPLVEVTLKTFPADWDVAFSLRAASADLAVERDWEHGPDAAKEAHELFNLILSLDHVTFAVLKSMGFTSA